MAENQDRRNKQMSEQSVQGALLLHILGHWAFFVFAMGVYLYFVEMLSGDQVNVWKNVQQRHGPTLLAVIVFAPIVIRDVCKLTNRFAGPIVRLRRSMQELADGKSVKPIKFRDRDFWPDLAINFNRIAERVPPDDNNATGVFAEAEKDGHAAPLESIGS